MKKAILSLALSALVLFLSSPAAFADYQGGPCAGGKCPFKGRGMMAEEMYACPITQKVMTKAHFFLDNQKELELSDDQVRQIKEIKLETKKAYLRQMTEHQIFELDVQYKMSEPKLDRKGIDAMIDQVAKSMTASAKETVSAYEKLKAVLSEDQLKKAKDLWLGQKN